MFWTKYGTNTGVAESGTAEEIDQAVATDKPVMLYFSTRPIDPNKIDLEQHQKLRKFKEETYKKALVGTFNNPGDLQRILLRDLVRLVRTLKSRDKLCAEDEAKANDRRRESLEIGKQLLQPYSTVFRTPKLCVSLGPASPHREIATREELFAFVKKTASQNHLADPDQKFDIEFQKQALFKSPTIVRHQGNISCFQDAERFDPWDSRDRRLSTAKFIAFDQFGFVTTEIALYPREYATRFGPGGGGADPVKSYCFWHIVLYLRHLLAWTSKFYEQFSTQTELLVKMSLEELKSHPLKLEYGVSAPYDAAELSVTTGDLSFRSEQLNQPESLIITACYELLWNFRNDAPPSSRLLKKEPEW
jgi:hypothetical protein